jgi:hypothetical protein
MFPSLAEIEIEMVAQKLAERTKLASPGDLVTARRYYVREYVKVELERKGVRYYQVESGEIARAVSALMNGEAYDLKIPPAPKYEPPPGFGPIGVFVSTFIFILVHAALLAVAANLMLQQRVIFHRLGGLFFALLALGAILLALVALYQFLRTALMGKRKP